jgi:hypothetical protein
MMGTLLTWTVSGEGTYRAKIRNELDVLLRPFRRGPRKAGSIASGTKLNAATTVVA